MRVLCVAEKPSISKSISQILSGGQFETHNTPVGYIKNYEFDYPQTRSFYTVTCVTGHLTTVDFPDGYRKWSSCDPFQLFDAPVEVVVPPDKKGIERNLQSEARRADMLMIWTDCDREGEHIGTEIARVCRKVKPGIMVKRARFSAIIAQQIHNAAQHPHDLDQRQADAVDARIIMDLRIGAAFTRHQTLILQQRFHQIQEEKSVVSYGPCQFPTLGFIVQRYNYVKMFRPELFWYIYLSLSRPSASQGNEETKFNWKRGHIFQQEPVVNIFEYMMRSDVAKVTKVTNKPTKKWKPLPLTTVELQKAGSRLLRLAPKKMLDVAEKLYQQGFVSYPRTETDQFDPQFDFVALINKQTGDPVWGQFATSLQQGGFSAPRRGKNDDKAHPPIHPTNYAGNLAGDEKRVYEFITRRFLACCSKDAEGDQTTVDVEFGGEEFNAIGLVVREKNYLNVYVYDKWNGHYVPDFQEGETFTPTVCEIRQGETSKPNYLTEADLVTLMDKNGIGTDATIAQHIQTIIDRNYVIERFEGAIKYLVPSTLGIGLIEGYNEIGLTKSVGKPQLRRETERRMMQVCQGTTTKQDMIERSLDQYKEMYIIIKREFDKVVTSVHRYLSGEPNANANGGNGNPPPGGGGGNGPRGGRGRGRGRGGGNVGGGGGRNNGDDDSDDEGDTGASTTGRGRGRGRGVSSRGRGAARGRTTDRELNSGASTIPLPPPPPPPALVPALAAPPPPPPPPPPADMLPEEDFSNILDYLDDDDDDEDSWIKKPSTSRVPAKPSTVTTYTVPNSASGTSTSRGTSLMTTASSSGQYSSPASSIPHPIPSDMGHDVMCTCTPPRLAVKREITRESPQKGRPFFACIDPDGCGFFKWAGDVQVGSSSSGSGFEGSSVIPAKRTYNAQTTESSGPERMCKCNEPGVVLTAQRDGLNKGRKFWKCRKEEEVKCNFFEWDDEPPRTTSGASTSFGREGGGPASGGGSGGQTGMCFKCDQEGHWASSCPNGDSNKRPRSFGTNGSSSLTCFKCSQPGHISTACPNDYKGSSRSASFNNSSSGATSAKCYKCGQSGHYSSSCHAEGGSKRSYSSGSTSKRGRGGSTGGRGKRGGGRGGKKKSAFGAPDDSW